MVTPELQECLKDSKIILSRYFSTNLQKYLYYTMDHLAAIIFYVYLLF